MGKLRLRTAQLRPSAGCPDYGTRFHGLCPAARRRVATGRDGTPPAALGSNGPITGAAKTDRSRFGPLSSNCCKTSEGALHLPARTAERGLRVFRWAA